MVFRNAGRPRPWGGAAFTLALCLSGCGTYEPKPHVTPIERETAVYYTADLTGTVIFDPSTSSYTCTHPTPDATFTQEESGDFALSLVSLGGSVEQGAGNEGSAQAEMGGRTPSVLITRELFFRLCEFARNYDLNKQEATTLYNKTLDIVQDVWSIEAGNTTVTVSDAITDAAQIRSMMPVSMEPTSASPGLDGNNDEDDPDDK